MTEMAESNESLLLEMLDCGSSTLQLIFQYVTSLKEKVRLQRVCRSFRRHARTFEAWSDVKTIEIKGAHFYWINKDPIPRQYLKSAIESIISFSRNVHILDLRYCDSLTAYESITNSFIQARSEESIHSYRKVYRLIVSGHNSPEISAQILLLLDVLKDQLKCLKLTFINRKNETEMAQLWATIGECAHLDTFAYSTNDLHISAEMVKSALRNKTIGSLYLNLQCLGTAGLIDIIDSVINAQSFHHLYGNSQYMSLGDIAANLPSVHWSNITKVVYYHFDSLSSTSDDWQIILRLPHLAPKLTTLVLKHIHNYSKGFELNQATELIVAYLAILNQRNSSQSDIFTLCLLSKASYSATISSSWIRQEVRESLKNEHYCEIESLPGDIVRIRSSGSEHSAVIEINNKL